MTSMEDETLAAMNTMFDTAESMASKTHNLYEQSVNTDKYLN